MGWDIDRFPEGEVKLDLICCICTSILEDPVESPCRHVFCSQCIKTWLSSQKTCPHCRAPVHRKDLQGVVPLLKSIISKQKIYCDNRDKGCEEVVALEMLQSHVAVCSYGMAVCPNDGCGLKVLRKDLRTHNDNCPKRTVLCDQGCEMLLTLEEKNSHNCIQALQRHFEERTNDMLSRISKLEELVNVLVSKSTPITSESRQDNIHASNSWPPYTIPSPRPSQVSNYSVFTGNNARNNEQEFSDTSSSGSESTHDMVSHVETARSRRRYGLVSPIYYQNVNRETDNDRDEQHYLDGQTHQRSRSPLNDFRRNTESNEPRREESLQRNPHRRIRQAGSERPQNYSHRQTRNEGNLVLRIGVLSETISESSRQSTSSGSDTE